MSAGAISAAAAAAARAQAVKASGAIVKVEPEHFLAIIARSAAPLVVCAPGGFWSRGFQYLSAYRGLIFYSTSQNELTLPADAEVVNSQKIWIPG